MQSQSLSIEKALFTVTRRSANVFLVLQIHKVLQGDVEALVESYSKIGVGALPALSSFPLKLTYLNRLSPSAKTLRRFKLVCAVR